MDLFVIGDHNTVYAFSLAGIQGEVAENRETALQALRALFNKGTIKILLLTERLAQHLKEQIEELEAKSHFPLVIEIPDFYGPLPDRKSVRTLVKESIGISI